MPAFLILCSGWQFYVCRSTALTVKLNTILNKLPFFYPVCYSCRKKRKISLDIGANCISLIFRYEFRFRYVLGKESAHSKPSILGCEGTDETILNSIEEMLFSGPTSISMPRWVSAIKRRTKILWVRMDQSARIRRRHRRTSFLIFIIQSLNLFVNSRESWRICAQWWRILVWISWPIDWLTNECFCTPWKQMDRSTHQSGRHSHPSPQSLYSTIHNRCCIHRVSFYGSIGTVFVHSFNQFLL